MASEGSDLSFITSIAILQGRLGMGPSPALRSSEVWALAFFKGSEVWAPVF